MRRIKKKPREGLCCVAAPVTLIRRPGEDGDPGRSYTSASRHAVVVSARYRVAGCARILPDACLRLSHLTAFTTTGIALMDWSSGSSLPSHAVVSPARPPLRRNAIPVVCSFYRQKPRRQHLCIVERLLDCVVPLGSHDNTTVDSSRAAFTHFPFRAGA